MSWHYRLRKRSDQGEVYYDIVEYYPDLDSWTENSITPIAESRDHMIRVLDMMRDDVLKYPLLDKNESESN
jgi:hypothetical protein